MTEVPRLDAAAGAPAPRVSVVMPTFKRPHRLGAAIRSLLRGEWRDIELLVRDDGDGSDGAEEAVMAAAAGDPRVHYQRNPRRLGMPGNINEGIRTSRGELIAICHDHDLYAPEFLSRMVEALDRHPTALFAHCAIEVIDGDGVRIRSHVGGWPELVAGREWLGVMLESFACPVCALTLVRRRAHEEHGLYNPAFGFISDIEMWMRLSLHGDVAYVARPLIHVREREAGHEADGQELRFLRTLARMHRQYLRLAYRPVQRIPRRFMLELRCVTRASRAVAAMVKRRALAPKHVGMTETRSALLGSDRDGAPS